MCPNTTWEWCWLINWATQTPEFLMTRVRTQKTQVSLRFNRFTQPSSHVLNHIRSASSTSTNHPCHNALSIRCLITQQSGIGQKWSPTGQPHQVTSPQPGGTPLTMTHTSYLSLCHSFILPNPNCLLHVPFPHWTRERLNLLGVLRLKPGAVCIHSAIRQLLLIRRVSYC